MDFSFSFFLEALAAGLSAVPRSLFVALSAVAVGIVFGMGIAILRFYQVMFVEPVLKLLVTIVQGIPIILFYFVFYLFFVDFPAMPLVYIASLSLVPPASIRLSEVFRGALLSIDKSQFDAAYAIGHSEAAVFFRIILPQLVPVSIPPAINIVIQMLKSVPIAMLIGLNDILNTALLEATVNYRYLEAYFAAALIFWGLFIVIERASGQIEEHFKSVMRKSV
ncbi:MAG: ABC transporter permease subunit [Treponema sp.]|jgi:L-cystine transport system permease protein|nr:ABC transporter permease subunit [Treponema sp.]